MGWEARLFNCTTRVVAGSVARGSVAVCGSVRGDVAADGLVLWVLLGVAGSDSMWRDVVWWDVGCMGVYGGQWRVLS